MKIIMVLLILLSSVINADEMFFGYGNNYSVPGGSEETTPVVSFKYEFDDVFYSVNYRPDYTLYGNTVEDHFIFGMGYKIFQYDFNDNIYVYVDFGLSATSKISPANSSRVMFLENFGLSVYGFRLVLNHNSNAGIKGANEGQTYIGIEYSFTF